MRASIGRTMIAVPKGEDVNPVKGYDRNLPRDHVLGGIPQNGPSKDSPKCLVHIQD